MACKYCKCSPCCCSTPSCPSEESTCPARTSSVPSCLSTFVRYSKYYCYKVGDGVINIFCALKDIAAAIREYTDAVNVKGYASGSLHFAMDGGATVAPNDVTELQFSKSPFNFKVLGIGVSIIDFNECGGVYFSDSQLSVKFWDYTSGVQVGSTLLLTSSQLHDKDTNEGLTISDNIYPGHIYGVKITYTNTHGTNCELPDMYFYLLVGPIEITTSED